MATAAKGVKKPPKKSEKKVGKSSPRAAAKAKKTARRKVAPKSPADKRVAAKDLQLAKLKEELNERNRQVKESLKVLKDAMTKAEKEVADSKKKAGEELRNLQRKADAEMKKMEKELLLKGRILQEKEKELEDCRKEAQAIITAPGVPVQAPPAEKERAGLTTFKGNPMTLVGKEVRVGERAPDFRVIDNGMQPAGLNSFQGKIKIITSVPSLDTPVCSMETRRFNEEAAKLPDKAAVLTVSMDLPFAQARWCAAAGVEKVKTFSDYQDRSFGLRYGVLVKELKLLARAVFILDDQDIIRYVELVPEIGREPDYNQALNAARALL
jgi:thioredoxin-dependent peroxiredoxin